MEVACIQKAGDKGYQLLVRVLRTHVQKLKGLLLSSGNDDSVVLMNCASIHTFFMRFPIDVCFVGRDGRVLSVCRRLPPFRTACVPQAYCVIERPASCDAWFDLTDKLMLRQVGNDLPK